MRMAKPSENDIDAAGELMQVLDAIDRRWGGPQPTADAPDDLFEFLDEDGFDEDNDQHLRVLYNHLAKLLRKAPNFQGRVIGGMCYVIMYDKNEIIDPNDDCIDLHPKLRGLLNNLAPTP